MEGIMRHLFKADDLLCFCQSYTQGFWHGCQQLFLRCLQINRAGLGTQAAEKCQAQKQRHRLFPRKHNWWQEIALQEAETARMPSFSVNRDSQCAEHIHITVNGSSRYPETLSEIGCRRLLAAAQV